MRGLYFHGLGDVLDWWLVRLLTHAVIESEFLYQLKSISKANAVFVLEWLLNINLCLIDYVAQCFQAVLWFIDE